MHQNITLWNYHGRSLSCRKVNEHFLQFVEKVKIDLQFMLHLGMDGPNVNVKCENLLQSSEIMKNLNTNIIFIRTCPLHIVHNSFRAWVNVFNFKIDLFIIDVNIFFQAFIIDVNFFFQALCWKKSRLSTN